MFGAPAAGAYGAQQQPVVGQQMAPPGPTQVTDADIFNAFLQQMAKAWDSNDYRMCSFKCAAPTKKRPGWWLG